MKLTSEFHKDTTKDGVHSICKECYAPNNARNNPLRRTVVCADGVKRRIMPSHLDYPHVAPRPAPTTTRFKPWAALRPYIHPELARIRRERTCRYAAADALEEAAKDGFVYIMHNSNYPWHVKIGHSRDPYKRLSEANVWCLDKEWKLKASRYFKNRIIAEGDIHRALDEFRAGGEFFEVSVSDAIQAMHRLADDDE